MDAMQQPQSNPQASEAPATPGTGDATAADRAEVRARAEAVLRELAGPAATLRDDQWKAIEALVVDHRRALVVQRTGWGSPPSTSSPPPCCGRAAPGRR